MKKKIAGLSVGLVLLTFICAWGAPVLDTREPVFDFGSVPQGQNVRHTFHFTNTGDEPLIIDKVRSSCGCTAALLSAELVPPGEAGELQTNFDSARFRGNVNKSIYLYSNDLSSPVHKFSVKGEVLELFGLVPRQLHFGPVQTGTPVSRTVTLTNRTEEDLRVAAVQTTSPQLQARFPGPLTSRGTGEIQVSLKPKPGKTRFSGYVILQLQGEKSYELRLPVYAQVSD